MTSSKANKRRFQEGAEALNRVNLSVAWEGENERCKQKSSLYILTFYTRFYAGENWR